MATPLISLLHPTARVKPSEAFPRGWKDAHDVWLSRADHPERIEYVLAVHESRWHAFCAEDIRVGLGDVPGIEVEKWYHFESVKNTKRDCVVDQTNCAAEASRGRVLMGVADDYYPPEHWDTLVLDGMSRFDLEAVMVCSTGATPERDRELMIGGACTRALIERRGYCLDPDFESMFSDNWWAIENRRDEAAGLLTIIERLDIQFEHRHPIFGKGQMDDIYRLQNRPEAYNDGAITLRRKMGAQMIAIGLPGQTFSSQWAHGWTKLYGHLMAVRNMLTMPIFMYTSNVHCTRIEWAEQVLESKYKPEWVLSIDDDNVLSPEQFDMLLGDLIENPDLAGVVGWCNCDPADPLGDKNLPYVTSCGRQSGWNADRTENGEGLGCKRFKIEDFERAFARRGKPLISSDDIAPDAFWSGFPVVLMRRETLQKLGPSAFLPMVRSDVKYGFTSEDTTFFYRAHQAGLKFAVDMRVKVPHLKLGAIEAQYLPGVKREEVLEAQGKSLAKAVAV